jgi:hypothetical protein
VFFIKDSNLTPALECFVLFAFLLAFVLPKQNAFVGYLQKNSSCPINKKISFLEFIAFSSTFVYQTSQQRLDQ